MLDIVLSCNLAQHQMGFISTSSYRILKATSLCNFQENWWTPYEKMAKKPLIFWPDFGLLGRNPPTPHPTPNFFWWVLPLLVFTQFSIFMCFSSTRYYTLLQAINLIKSQDKTSFRSDFGPVGWNLGPKMFFSKILPLLDLRQCWKLSLRAISRKAKEPNLRKW